MLIQIDIRDFATIESLRLNLQTATTMITGETGAGKSIFIEAIELALGGRASQQIIRPGKDRTDISLCFDIKHFPHVITRLKTLDLLVDTTECIIRRVITHDGRSRCYVNATPVTLQLVKELGELLFHLHGQHEQQVLIKAEKQRDMLDRYADCLPLAHKVKQLAEEWKSLSLHIDSLRKKKCERAQQLDYLRFQLDELKSLKLGDNEWEKLETEHKRLSHHEELINRISHVLHFLSGEDKNIINQLHDVRKNLEAILQVEPKSKNWVVSADSALIYINDLESELQNYLEKIDLDPENIRFIETRIGEIFNLARKYKLQPQDLPTYTQRLTEEFNALNTSDEKLLLLEKQLQAIENNYLQAANELAIRREEAAKRLEETITSTIRTLSLPYGEFKILLEKTSCKEIVVTGQEKIIFLIKTNPDQPLQPIAKIISGGELSRLSLALHLALADKTNIPTLIFDEVDTGLSGAPAEKIGKLLRELGQAYQVFCVTHQAQVAACGHHHLLVEKKIINKITYTHMKILNTADKTKEIARMIGGEKITRTTIAHAEEMLEDI